MIQGYNCPRPKIENYLDFLIKLESGLKNLNNPGLSLMLYGSYLRKDVQFGRSDIDALLIFPDEVIINKDQLLSASLVLKEALKDNPVKFQVTVSDLFTMQDGMFNSYNPTFAKYFQKEKRVIVGPDYTPTFKYSMPVFGDQGAFTFNIRKSRQGFLFSEHYKEENYEKFLEKFNATLDVVSRGSKQILTLIDEEVRLNRFSAVLELNKVFPSIDLSPLERIKFLYTNLDELDKLYHKPDELTAVWSESLTFLETIIKEYLRKYPNLQR